VAGSAQPDIVEAWAGSLRALSPGCPQAGGNLFGNPNGTQALAANGSTAEVVKRVRPRTREWWSNQATPEQENVLAKSLGADIPERDINDDVEATS